MNDKIRNIVLIHLCSCNTIIIIHNKIAPENTKAPGSLLSKKYKSIGDSKRAIKHNRTIIQNKYLFLFVFIFISIKYYKAKHHNCSA